MITISKVKQATSEFIKVLRYGKDDVQTADQYTPFGIDSKPVADTYALHATTGDNGESVILGYLSNSEDTEEGEINIFATDSDGNEVFRISLKNDGTVTFNGSDDNLIRYSSYESINNTLATNINAELTKIAAAITSLGGAYTPSTISVDSSSAKIDELLIP